MRLPYYLAPGQPRSASVPFVEVVYRNRSKKTTPILTLVDSGAQISFAPLDLAVWLKIRVDSKRALDIRGFNNTNTKCYPGLTQLEIDGLTIEIPIYYGGSAELQCILGQNPFFDYAKISFERYNNTFSIDWFTKKSKPN